jgi:hypothetical protein
MLGHFKFQGALYRKDRMPFELSLSIYGEDNTAGSKKLLNRFFLS